MNNKIVRDALKENGLKQWQLAELLGIGEYTMCRKLRKELPKEEQIKIADLIHESRKAV